MSGTRVDAQDASESGATLSRRGLVLGLLGATLGIGCRSRERQAPGAPPTSSAVPSDARWRELRFEPSEPYPEPEMALLRAEPGAPLLIALHGRGEAGRGLEAGARGWRDDYALDRADERLRSPPLTADDLLGFVHPERLAALNASLARTPYQGLCVACPYTPFLPDSSPGGASGFGRFVIDHLLPAARHELGLGAERARTGIDGVSMGGRLALLVGLAHPEAFAAVGALQPAVHEDEADALAELAVRAQAAAELRLRLVTSDGDTFRGAVEKLSAALRGRGVRHELLVTPGPHDYVYNRGPGSFEMQLWHERVLRGLPPA
jgi:iron(III)-salmochelin esterase